MLVRLPASAARADGGLPAVAAADDIDAGGVSLPRGASMRAGDGGRGLRLAWRRGWRGRARGRRAPASLRWPPVPPATGRAHARARAARSPPRARTSARSLRDEAELRAPGPSSSSRVSESESVPLAPCSRSRARARAAPPRRRRRRRRGEPSAPTTAVVAVVAQPNPKAAAAAKRVARSPPPPRCRLPAALRVPSARVREVDAPARRGRRRARAGWRGMSRPRHGFAGGRARARASRLIIDVKVTSPRCAARRAPAARAAGRRRCTVRVREGRARARSRRALRRMLERAGRASTGCAPEVGRLICAAGATRKTPSSPPPAARDAGVAAEVVAARRAAGSGAREAEQGGGRGGRGRVLARVEGAIRRGERRARQSWSSKSGNASCAAPSASRAASAAQLPRQPSARRRSFGGCWRHERGRAAERAERHPTPAQRRSSSASRPPSVAQLGRRHRRWQTARAVL